MRKKLVVLMIAGLMLMAFMATAAAQIEKSVTPLKFGEVYQKALELNKNRFPDLNKIQIGDIVLFPNRYGVGTEAWVADAPVAGVHDCIWLLSEKYCAGQLITAPVDTVKVTPPVPSSTELPEAKEDWTKGSLPFFIILAVLLLLLLIYWLTRRDRINRHPVITGGLSDDLPTATQQINAAYPNQPRALRVARGVINGPDNTRVSMHFSNGTRTVPLRSGEIVTRVERVGSRIDYYRSHCGNLFGEIHNGQFNLPSGWTFVETSTFTVTPVPAPVSETAITPAPVTVPAEVVSNPTADEIIRVLKAIKELKAVPTAITYGGLDVMFNNTNKEEKAAE